MKPHELDGVCMGGRDGRLYRVFEPRWWQLSRVLWIFAAHRFSRCWLWFKKVPPVYATITITFADGTSSFAVRAVLDRSIKLPNVPPASRRHDWN